MLKQFSVITGVLLLAAISAIAQPAAPSPYASLPEYVIGTGPTYTRGGVSAASLDLTFAKHIGTGQWYTWWDVSTPLIRPVRGTGPVVSSLAGGGAWTAWCSAKQTVCLLLIFQAGFTSLQTTSTAEPTFNGSFGVAYRPWKTVAVFPFVRANSITSTAASASPAPTSVILQPGLQILFTFGK